MYDWLDNVGGSLHASMEIVFGLNKGLTTTLCSCSYMDIHLLSWTAIFLLKVLEIMFSWTSLPKPKARCFHISCLYLLRQCDLVSEGIIVANSSLSPSWVRCALVFPTRREGLVDPEGEKRVALADTTYFQQLWSFEIAGLVPCSESNNALIVVAANGVQVVEVRCLHRHGTVSS